MRLLSELKKRLDENCVDFSRRQDETFMEEAAVCEEHVLERYLACGTVSDGDITKWWPEDTSSRVTLALH